MNKAYNVALVCLTLLVALSNIGRVEVEGQVFDFLSGAVNGMMESSSGLFEKIGNASGSIRNTTSGAATLSDPLSEYFESKVNDTERKKPDFKKFLEFIKVWKTPNASSSTSEK